MRLRRRPLTALFVATIAANAALLFVVEPLISKRVLPLFGGAPSVWNTCLVAFQALLLAGYLYADVVTRYLPRRAQGAVHLGAFALSLLVLPPAIHAAATPAGWPPAAWLLVLLLGAIGLPFVVLAAGAPLVQHWFAGLPNAGEPYFLYAASNVGSMVALLGYPLLIEPRLGLARQASVWGGAYAALGLALATCAAVVWLGARRVGIGTSSSGTESLGTSTADAAPPAALRDRLHWAALAFVPSSLLLGVTRYVTTDVAPVPLLWVLPLALYLLTFVVAFAERARVPDDVLTTLFAALLPVLALLTALGVNRPLWAIGGTHVVAVAVASLVCHQALADRRPAPARLTTFYLWVSIGGLAGGVFNALVAPAVFDSLAEYPIAIALAAAAWASSARDDAPVSATPRLFARLADAAPADGKARRLLWYVAGPLAAGGLLFASVMVRADVPTALRTSATVALGVPAALLGFALRRRPKAYALGVAALLVGATAGQRLRMGDVLFRGRSFFGAYVVRASGTYHHLQNGTTLHGAQNLDPAWVRTPITYYHGGGPLGVLFTQAPSLLRPGRRVAVVGLGTGSLACWGQTGERWTYYEIDPLIARVARDPRLFTFLRDCPPTVDVVLGDARLRLADAPLGTYDLIALDAFSSDAIPTHLLTREALALYVSRLAPDGLLAIHVSNRYLDLVPVLAELARDARLAGSVGDDVSGAARTHPMVSASRWVVLARRAALLAPVTRQRGWRPLPPRGDVRLWTDDFTDVLSIVKWQ